MTCDEVSELLPWLVTDRLDAEERERVERHLEGCSRCRSEREEVVFTLRSAVQHPSPAQLLALAGGGAVEGDSQALEDHVEHCPGCRAELDLVRQSYSLMDGGARRRRISGSRWRSLALAAGVAGAVAVGGWIWSWWALTSELSSLRTELAAQEAESLGGLGQPRTDLQVVEVLPDDLLLRGSPREELTVVAVADDRPTVLLLLTDDATSYDDFRAEIRDPEGRVLWQADGLLRQPGGNFAILLSPGSLAAPYLSISLAGRRGDRWAVIGDYRVGAENGGE